jgi:hypothetical protein
MHHSICAHTWVFHYYLNSFISGLLIRLNIQTSMFHLQPGRYSSSDFFYMSNSSTPILGGIVVGLCVVAFVIVVCNFNLGLLVICLHPHATRTYLQAPKFPGPCHLVALLVALVHGLLEVFRCLSSCHSRPLASCRVVIIITTSGPAYRPITIEQMFLQAPLARNGRNSLPTVDNHIRPTYCLSLSEPLSHRTTKILCQL